MKFFRRCPVTLIAHSTSLLIKISSYKYVYYQKLFANGIYNYDGFEFLELRRWEYSSQVPNTWGCSGWVSLLGKVKNIWLEFITGRPSFICDTNILHVWDFTFVLATFSKWNKNHEIPQYPWLVAFCRYVLF